MIPSINTVLDSSLEFARLPSLTLGLDFDRGCFKGYIDGLEAIRQAIFFRLLIYGKLNEFIGQLPPLIYVNIKNKIIETLLEDDRISEIHSFVFTKGQKSLRVQFTAETIEGITKTEVAIA